MKKTSTLIYVLILVGLASVVTGQDIHFSQFYMSPLNLNPAMTGVMNCDQRATINYRNQWAGVIGANAYNTYSASYDRKLAVGREDYFGVGGTLWGDVAGQARFGTKQARMSFSFSKKMGGRRDKSHYLSIGADAGLTQRGVNENDLRWPSQTTNGLFDGSAGQADVIPNANFLYADVAGGIMWFSTFGDRLNIYGGAALHHLNQPTVSHLNNPAVSLFSRLTVHLGGEYPLNKKISLKPDVIYLKQGPHTQLNAGTSVRFKVGASDSRFNSGALGQFFQIGAWYRVGNKAAGGLHSDAFILATRFEFDQYSIGLSYDLNVSSLSQAASANGSFELSGQYLLCGSTSRAVYCPVF